MAKPLIIQYGKGKWAALHNNAPTSFMLDGKQWPSITHYVEAQQFLNEADREIIRKTLDTRTTDIQTQLDKARVPKASTSGNVFTPQQRIDEYNKNKSSYKTIKRGTYTPKRANHARAAQQAAHNLRADRRPNHRADRGLVLQRAWSANYQQNASIRSLAAQTVGKEVIHEGNDPHLDRVTTATKKTEKLQLSSAEVRGGRNLTGETIADIARKPGAHPTVPTNKVASWTKLLGRKSLIAIREMSPEEVKLYKQHTYTTAAMTPQAGSHRLTTQSRPPLPTKAPPA